MMPSAKLFDEKTILINKIIKLLANLCDLVLYNDIFAKTHPILMKLIESDANLEESQFKSLRETKKSIEQLKDCEAKVLLLSQIQSK